MIGEQVLPPAAIVAYAVASDSGEISVRADDGGRNVQQGRLVASEDAHLRGELVDVAEVHLRGHPGGTRR